MSYEEKYEVKTFKVVRVCTKCGGGELLPTGECLSSYPPLYPHKCNTCNYSEIFSDITYPYISHERKKQ